MATTDLGTLDNLKDLISELQQSSLSDRIIAPGSEEYQTSLASYFSQQAQSLQPEIIVVPKSAQEVSEVVKIIAKYYKFASKTAPCFAVRGGGQNPAPGLSNIQSGVTIDLSALNHVDALGSTAKIGPGARWDEVYSVLCPLGRGVAGGRGPWLGVGGLTLGGGLSYFSPERGFVCDDIVSFEVVLADGSIVQATQTSYPDLWRALKGGSNNFGIVTSFEFKTFELGKIWAGGHNTWPFSTASQHLDAFFDFATNPSPDEHASIMSSFGVYKGNVIVNQGLSYSKPIENPPALSKFLEIEGRSHSNNGIKTLEVAVQEMGAFNTTGRRQGMMTTTFITDRAMLQYAVDAFHASVPAVQKLKDVNWNMTFQPLTPAIIQKSQQSGGNVMGLEGAPPLTNVSISISWDDAKDDNFLINTALIILKDIDETSKSRGKYHPYLYLNYAWNTQDPISGYGEANGEFMRNVSRKYDPTGLFQIGLAGGFKLAGKAGK